ncbi:hypothetical protein C4544_05240 [candidate division WS5 bacterium]|uniref:Uncharacterized protein n=1 Tax=candidate division WS5 bacterium TaxID=2093353 RepID=A0A419DB68_9BACT|nr:MAG: hypothetical protein C4544_05240 [candidate division WS5 bacterium]
MTRKITLPSGKVVTINERGDIVSDSLETKPSTNDAVSNAQKALNTIKQIREAGYAGDIPGNVDLDDFLHQVSSKTVPQPPKYQTGNEILDETLKGVREYLETLKAQGMKLNPAIEITPEVTQRFINQAETELSPYYSSRIKVIKNDLNRNLETLNKQYLSQKARAETEFRNSLAATQEDFADRGLTFSGQRQKTEGQFGESAGRYFEDLASSFAEKGREFGTTAERTLGSRELDGLTSPSITTYKPEIGTDFNLSETGSRSLFSPESGVVGSLEREKLAAKKARELELEKAYRQNRALTFY